AHSIVALGPPQGGRQRASRHNQSAQRPHSARDPAAITTYCFPFLARYVIGVPDDRRGSGADHTSAPVSVLTACSAPSPPPTNTSPPAVTIAPGAPGAPRRSGSPTSLSAGCCRSDGRSPNGTFHAIVPRLRSIAVRCPYGPLSRGIPS